MADCTVGAVAACRSEIPTELKWSVKVTVPALLARAQPSGTWIETVLPGGRYFTKTWLSGMSPGGLNSVAGAGPLGVVGEDDVGVRGECAPPVELPPVGRVLSVGVVCDAVLEHAVAPNNRVAARTPVAVARRCAVMGAPAGLGLVGRALLRR